MSQRIQLESATVAAFLNELASGSPAPGGGSASAMAGATGAALTSMVANLTIGRAKYRDNEPAMKEILGRSESARKEFARLVEEDMQSFDRVMEAYRLPKNSPEEVEARKAAIENALKGACAVPLRTMRLSLECLGLAEQAARLGNANALSDAAVSGLLLRAAVAGAGYNVLINLTGIADEGFRRETLTTHDTIIREAEDTWSRIRSVVEQGVVVR
ncbi:MAG: cyclodeaminase/cyclohydrolase family protein [Ignavibacteriales bacterium]